MSFTTINALPPELLAPVFLCLSDRSDFVSLALTSRFCYSVASAPATSHSWFQLHHHRFPECPFTLTADEMTILEYHFEHYRTICLWLSGSSDTSHNPPVEPTLSREVSLALTHVLHSRRNLNELTMLPAPALRKMFGLCASWDNHADNTVLPQGGLSTCFRPGRGRIRKVYPQDSGAAHEIYAFFDLELSRSSGKYDEGTTFPFMCLCMSGNFAGFGPDCEIMTGKMLFKMHTPPWEIQIDSDEMDSLQEMSVGMPREKPSQGRWKRALGWVRRKLRRRGSFLLRG